MAYHPYLRQSAAVLAASLSILLAACGGGGGDSTPAGPTVTSFPLAAGYQARVTSGATDTATISGDCSGNATLSASGTSAATFETVNGFSATSTITQNLVGCTPASSAVTSVTYFNATFTPIGSSTPGTEYAKFTTAPQALPSSVSVGSTAVFGTLTLYSDSTKTTITGTRELSYVVQADSSNTAIVVFITRSFNTSSQLTFTQQTRYRIAANGTLTLVSIDVQRTLPSSLHVVYTKT